MKNLGISLALAAALAAGTLSTAGAQAKGRGDGVRAQRHPAAQHQPAGPRASARTHRPAGRSVYAHRPARRSVYAHRRAHSAKRFAQLDRHYRSRWQTMHRWRGRQFRRPPIHGRRPIHVRHIQVVPDSAPIRSRSLDVQTPDFSFSVSDSG